MAKRFTDSEKYKHRWLRELSPEGKLIWDYLIHVCDHAGVWPEDYPQASFALGLEVTKEGLEELFGQRIIRISGDKLFIPSFVRFQYSVTQKLPLNETNKAHLGVIRQLERYGINPVSLLPSSILESDLSEAPSKPLDSPLEAPSKGHKNRNRNRNRSNQRGSGGDFDFESIWKCYPNKVNKSQARLRFERLIQAQHNFDDLGVALKKFLAYHADKQTDPKFLPHMATFLGTEKAPAWKDWLDADAGKVVTPLVSRISPPRVTQADPEPEHELPPQDILKSHGALFGKLGIGKGSA